MQAGVGIPTAACCPIGIFSWKTGSICERTHSTCLLRWSDLRWLDMGQIVRGGGKCLHDLDLEVGLEVCLEVGLEVGLEMGLTAQRKQRTAPKGVQQGLYWWVGIVWGSGGCSGGSPGGEGCTWVWEEHILLPKAASPRWL